MKLLWIGDAVTQTGFARVTHNVLQHLSKKWQVQVLGVNYNGDPHDFPYPIWPAVPGGDVYGMNRIGAIAATFKPDLIFVMNDPWIVAEYLKAMPENTPVVAYMPVDAPNQTSASRLERLTRSIAYTHFGRRQLALGGFSGPINVIPHGVDTDLYQPQDKLKCREMITFREPTDLNDLFIVGNVNRNQPRKRLDLTMQYWTEWWVRAGQPKNAMLYFHCSNRDEGWDVLKLAKYYGINKNFIITNPEMTTRNCMLEQDMPKVYGMFDVHFSTPLGEGWGLTVHEAMACGIAQIVPRYSALGEWCHGAVHYVGVSSFQVTPKNINTIGGVADMEESVAAIQKFWEDREYRREMGQLALARATEARFKWANIAEQFHIVLTETVLERRESPVGIGAVNG